MFGLFKKKYQKNCAIPLREIGDKDWRHRYLMAINIDEKNIYFVGLTKNKMLLKQYYTIHGKVYDDKYGNIIYEIVEFEVYLKDGKPTIGGGYSDEDGEEEYKFFLNCEAEEERNLQEAIKRRQEENVKSYEEDVEFNTFLNVNDDGSTGDDHLF